MAAFGFTTWAELGVWVLKFLVGRQEIAQDPALKKRKEAQQTEAQADEIERLTAAAMREPDPKKKAAALKRVQEMSGE